jgi:hypothetical protein
MNASKINLNFPQLAKADYGLAVDVVPYRNYENNKPSETIAGYKYTTVLPLNGYEKIGIKVEQPAPLFTKEDIEKGGGSIKIKPIGFQGKFYRTSSGDLDISCKATGIEVVK